MGITNSPTGRMRTQGVVPVNANNNNAPVKTLMHCMPVFMYAIELGDENGKKVTTVCFKMGDTIYTDPNGEQWGQNLRTVAKTSWLYKQLLEAIASHEKVNDVPAEDAVDVVG